MPDQNVVEASNKNGCGAGDVHTPLSDSIGNFGETSSNNNNGSDKYQCSTDTKNCEINQSPTCATNKSSIPEPTEIPPPPGAPRTENPARLRRYRLNLE